MISGICVVGTGTEVGKTVISAALCSLLRKYGLKAGYFKPVLSGALSEKGRLVPGDTRFVCQAANIRESWEKLTPCMYENSLSPHLAARLEKRPVNPEKILRAFQELGKNYDFLVVEAAGGLGIPLNDEGLLMVDLLNMFRLPGLLVAPAGLGGINQALLSAEYAKNRGFPLVGILLNFGNGDFLEEDNALQIAKLTKLPVYGPFPRLVSPEATPLGDTLEPLLSSAELLFLLQGEHTRASKEVCK